MKTLLIVSLALLAAAQGKSLRDDDSPLVQVSVYYETLCPDSISFIVHQLYPGYYALKEYIDLELVPWGHASEEEIDGVKNFTCQHGPTECYGNKVHACVIDMASEEVSTEFVFCSERSDAPADDTNLQQCAEEVDLSWSEIQECVVNGKGDELLSENGRKTNLVSPTFIPTIILNGTYDQTTQDQALLYFKTLICNLIGFRPECLCRK
ncbi:gamma-interferon-inducible lysosomal thiol reductase-like isoform X2 [Dendroctonus ponderosae]|uniref:Gamma-interferon-inducible lysosomal thiol reductase n=1 Tax=Dendroctonus ponderosae TaxID=77166 RepID=J3JZ74_DENPD|nr:gamma-interferon-inducible lysosomal thiol reductase-like isoform X2 [Dendroctonus ponderosae]AEE63512.1 unknown [Dendroctonus ponderosae]ERL95191.1 hypothetical protein D910_12459 [Dendroctonus ponderosae]